MLKNLLFAAALASSTSAFAQSAPAPTVSGPPSTMRPALTKSAAMQWFYLDVARCLYALEHNITIGELPLEAKADLRPALPPERFLYRDPAVRVWTTDLYGSHVVMAEKTADRCEVVADQLPVQTTFSQVLTRLHGADIELAEFPVKSGYNPVAYQLERTAGGYRYIVHMEGSEPGGLGHPLQMLQGHAAPFSVLTAYIIRQPIADKPPFR